MNLVLSDVIEKVGADSSYAFTSIVLSAAATLGDGPRFHKLLVELKQAGLAMTEWKKAVNKRRDLLHHKQQVARAKAKGRRVFARGDDTELAIALLDELADKDRQGTPEHSSLVYAEGMLHAYERALGIWKPIADREESLIVQGFAGSIVGEKNVLLVNEPRERGSIRLAHRRAHQPEFFEQAPAGVMFKNGFVEVTAQGVRLRDGLPSDRARHRFEFDYGPSVPGRLLDFFEAVFKDDTDKAERITLLQEFLGACFLGIAPRFQNPRVHDEGQAGVAARRRRRSPLPRDGHDRHYRQRRHAQPRIALQRVEALGRGQGPPKHGREHLPQPREAGAPRLGSDCRCSPGGLTDTQRASVLREGSVHTRKGNRYPLRMIPRSDDISAEELAAIIDLDEARARVKAGEGG